MRRLVLAVVGLPAAAISIAVLGAIGGAGACNSSQPEPVGGVPAQLAPLFAAAASAYRLGPEGGAILAAINYVESDFGQSTASGVHSGTNSAGAAGPMQIGIGGAAGDTWSRIALSAPGDPPGQQPNVYSESDAVYSAAHYLAINGMTANPATWQGAIWHYDHAAWYVQRVLALARGYLPSTTTFVSYDACDAVDTTPARKPRSRRTESHSPRLALHKRCRP